MPVPANTPNLTLGRSLFDKRQFRPDTDPAIIATLERLAQALSGAGWPAAAKSGDTTYQQLYGRFVTDEWFIYAGRPDDPTNPDLVTPTTSGSTTVLVEDDGVLVGAFGTLNFKDNLTAVDAGGGVCDIDGTGGGGGGTVTEAFKTIQVSGSSDIVADLAADTLTIVAGTYMDVTADAGTDTLTYSVDLNEIAGFANPGFQIISQTDGVHAWISASSLADGVGYDEIQGEGTPVTKWAKLNFIGDGVTVTDDGGNSRTNVTLSFPFQTVVITSSIAAATWDAGAEELTPAEDTANVFAWEDVGGGVYGYDSGDPVTVLNFYNSVISVGAGKGKIAHVFNGRIISVDCNEITL
jgi:hypothetical protein